MRKFSTLILICLMALTITIAIGEDEISLMDILESSEQELPNDPEQLSTPEPTSFYEEDGSVLITLTATGDVTIGRNYHASGTGIFDRELKKQKGDINFPFRNFKSIFEADDLTIINFEGTLTETSRPPGNKAGNDYLFKAPPEYAQTLPDNFIEAAALENNHIMDFGDEGLAQTKEALKNAGVVYASEDDMGVITVKGIDIALLAYQTFNNAYDRLFDKVPADIQKAKEKYPIVIVSFHWGAELDYKPNANQQKMGKIAIDAGADLVLGHHSHRINPIEEYQGKYIVYSMANFSFAGNSKPSDMSTFAFQTRFRVTPEGEVTPEGFRIIPARISSRTDYNDFTPTPYEKQSSIDSLISVLKKNGQGLENPVSEYPLQFN